MNNLTYKKNNILFSIVLCTYNREKQIEKCLTSLLNQDFPKDRYEIILVDDGSKDATVKLASQYPIRIIENHVNKGLSVGRNKGLRTARGKVYVSFDDDCLATENWLSNLAKVYEKYDLKEISGIGGFIKLNESQNGILEKYLDESGYGNPSPVEYGKSKNIFYRFYAYLKNMYSPKIQTNKNVQEVNEIWGANSSFPIAVLKAVKGWDTKLSGVEDTDLCSRIREKFPAKKFFFTKNAIIYHDHKLSLNNFLKKPYSRGEVIYKFYRQNSKIPPIFPFPILTILILLFGILAIFPHGILSLILIPPLLYSWWLIKAISKKKLYFLLFPYIQGGYELFSILGIAKAILSYKKL